MNIKMTIQSYSETVLNQNKPNSSVDSKIKNIYFTNQMPQAASLFYLINSEVLPINAHTYYTGWKITEPPSQTKVTDWKIN